MSTVDRRSRRESAGGARPYRRRTTPPARRRPTYGTATRLARIVHGLSARPLGWSFEAIQDEVGISERTLLRYLAACRSELVDAEERPLLEVVRRGERRLLRLAQPAGSPDPTPYQALSFYLALAVFQFLDGTVLKEGVEDLWQQFSRKLPSHQQLRLADFKKKFYAIPYAPKDYRAFDHLLDVIVQCLVQERRMRIDYGGLLGEGKVHDFDPYTLLMYRGGLYLIGYSHRAGKILYLAVERIRGAEKLAERFEYPPGYSPARHTEGSFGIIAGPQTRVELLVLDPETVAYLAARRLHPTQRFERRRDGTAVLRLQVRGIAELASWVLSFGPHMKVLRPLELRDEVSDQLHRAASYYAAGSRSE